MLVLGCMALSGGEVCRCCGRWRGMGRERRQRGLGRGLRNSTLACLYGEISSERLIFDVENLTYARVTAEEGGGGVSAAGGVGEVDVVGEMGVEVVVLIGGEGGASSAYHAEMGDCVVVFWGDAGVFELEEVARGGAEVGYSGDWLISCGTRREKGVG